MVDLKAFLPEAVSQAFAMSASTQYAEDFRHQCIDQLITELQIEGYSLLYNQRYYVDLWPLPEEQQQAEHLLYFDWKMSSKQAFF